MVHISKLRYPKKSHQKFVTIPTYSKDLAEFFGIMIGDGGINNEWQANITLNSIADKKYSEYVLLLCKKLFGISPSIRKRKGKNALLISLASTTIVDFLINNGLPRGDKLKNGLKIPLWIVKKPSLSKMCVRGLIDTDGCMFIHKHTIKGKEYRNIGLTFTSYSNELILQVAKILDNFSIIPHISGQGRHIYLYREESVKMYLSIFGSSNERIISVYTKWRDARVV